MRTIEQCLIDILKTADNIADFKELSTNHLAKGRLPYSSRSKEHNIYPLLTKYSYDEVIYHTLLAKEREYFSKPCAKFRNGIFIPPLSEKGYNYLDEFIKNNS